MKSTQSIQKQVLALALLAVVSGPALAEPVYKFRIPAKGLKSNLHAGPVAPGGQPGGTTPTTPASPENETAHFSIAKSGFTMNRMTGVTSANVTVTNASNEPVYGPLHLVFNQITEGVTLSNPTGSYGGLPYITMTTTSAPVLPGQNLVVTAQFSNPQKVGMSFSTLVYSGYLSPP